MTTQDEIWQALGSIQEAIEVVARSRPIVVKHAEGFDLITMRDQLVELVDLRDKETLRLFELVGEAGWPE